MTEKPWNTPSLKKGEGIETQLGTYILIGVNHVDRTVDPYLAGVFHKGVLVYSGLHPTLADARQVAMRKAKDIEP